MDKYPATLSVHLDLCTRFFPCSLTVRGHSFVELHCTEKSSISCLSSVGCTELEFEYVDLVCAEEIRSESVIKIQGSKLHISNTTFAGCGSKNPGAVINSYDQAQLNIQSSVFQNIFSEGLGGAIASVGSSINLSLSDFLNCSSRQGGGAIWISSYRGCYGTPVTVNATVKIVSSDFVECRSWGPGGAIFASPDVETQSNMQANIYLSQTSFIDCWSFGNGGAISATHGSELALIDSLFYRNAADGMGGGAVHLKDAFFLNYGSVFLNNTALYGGGGAVFWESKMNPALFHDCPAKSARSLQISSGGTYSWLSCVDNNTSKLGNCVLNQSPYTSPQTTLKNSSLESNVRIIYSKSSNNSLPNLDNGICCFQNRAKYGICIASDFKRLNIEYDEKMFVFPGISFTFIVGKIDAYNQTIRSDSNSLIQAYPHSTSANGSRKFLIAGSALSVFQEGVARFSFAIKPYFVFIDARSRHTAIFETPSIFLMGLDLQTSEYMRSDLVSISISKDSGVCPAGFVLVSDATGGVSGLASCSLCPPGTYSIDPLGGYQAPGCLNCPAGGICLEGGDDIRFLVGTWGVSNGKYLILSCPANYQLINSSDGTSRGKFSHDVQQCKPCSSTEYIVDPNIGACNPCPKGARCPSDFSCSLQTSALYPHRKNCPAGDQVIGDWEIDALTGTYVLKSCPGNYTLIDSYEAGTPDLQRCEECTSGQYIVYPDWQDCQTCPKGAVCPDLSCAFRNPPFFECFHGDSILGEWLMDNFSGTFVLVNCPPGYTLISTAQAGSKDLQHCTQCLPGQYIISPSTDACQTCPKGALCPDLSCAFGNPSFTCLSKIPIIGDWIVSGKIYRLINCPLGTTLLNSTVGSSSGAFSAEIQQCKPCPQDTYIIHPNTDECQACPPGCACWSAFCRSSSCRDSNRPKHILHEKYELFV